MHPNPTLRRRLGALLVLPALALSLLVMAVAAAPAGAATGSVSGTVKDQSGRPVPFAHVVLDDLEHPTLHTVTNASGAYSFSSVPFASYQVEVQAVCKQLRISALEVNGAEKDELEVRDAFVFDGADHTCRPGAGFALIDDQTLLPLSGDDEATTVALPFAFPFYDGSKTSMLVSTNGYLTFGTQGRNNANLRLTDPATPTDSIFVFWDDLVVDDEASVSTAALGTAPNRVFMVEWANVRFFGDTAGHRVTFQVQLFENGRIQMAYRDLDGSTLEAGGSATIGLRSTGFDALQAADDNRASLVDGTKVEYITNHAPVVSAGPDLKVASGKPIPLKGAANDQGPMTFEWTQLNPVTSTITNKKTLSATASGVKGPKQLTFGLTATDEFGRETTDFVTVDVAAPK